MRRKTDDRGENHLAGQTSPYLLQHVRNPVDWYPWGTEALARARDENKPIFLSIGYAACHWCHVMERESFENETIADYLNRHFVSIKVDREERPDIDEIYMNAVQLMTRSGGWPLNVFLTPETRPFFGGTYFPPDDRHGRPGFLSVLSSLQRTWSAQPERVAEAAREMTGHLQSIADAVVSDGADRPGLSPGSDRIVPSLGRQALAELAGRFDRRWGGFGPAPKFPPDGALDLLLRESQRPASDDEGREALTMVTATLSAMAVGGLYDHVGGGFARYSVDERWLIPHFEKMLYNQALLVPLYADAYALTGQALFRETALGTLDFVVRELRDGGGGFYSSLDADSEGEEGKFYVWTPTEAREALQGFESPRVDELFLRYDLTDRGNFEGSNHLNRILDSEAGSPAGDQATERLRPLLDRLLDARGARVRPGTDDKVLTAWNGLAIGAFARAYQAFGREADRSAARDCADFVRNALWDGNGLQVTWRRGEAQLNAYLDDYAFLARGVLELYESDFRHEDLLWATELARALVDRFFDEATGAFFFVGHDHESLLTRNRSLHDGALPAGSGVAAEVLLRLGTLWDDSDLIEPAERMLHCYGVQARRSPSGFASHLKAAEFVAGDRVEVVFAGNPDDPALQALIRTVHRHYIPARVLALHGKLPGWVADKPAVDGKATAYVCRNRSCRAPVTDPASLQAALAR